jgi:hypothetical protein
VIQLYSTLCKEMRSDSTTSATSIRPIIGFWAISLQLTSAISGSKQRPGIVYAWGGWGIASQPTLRQAPYISKKENINTFQLFGAPRVRKERQQAGKNGTAKCIFLLENMIIFSTLIFIWIYFRSASAPNTLFEIMQIKNNMFLIKNLEESRDFW